MVVKGLSVAVCIELSD